ncbi:MAG: aminotransferase class I/II-fold pyridoxal phosphate-dependent enzyme [Candidatus Shapirobacteria bacterium]|jgi:dTDP-4-amino-4,6-dideoxygalactose transaminase
MARLIFTGLSPNAERDDLSLAASLLLSPWKWIHGEGAERLERMISTRLNRAEAIAFTSGRGALASILEALHLPPGSGILLQAYSCVVDPNAIHWAGYVPVFVDIEEDSLNMDPDDLERKWNPTCRAVIIQHTMGRPANMDRLMEIAQRRHLVVIEDCAHALGATYHRKEVGSFGDAAFFSFGRDKIISSVFGGCAVTRDIELAKRIRAIRTREGAPRRAWTLQQLFHPLFLLAVKATYRIGLGPILFVLGKKTRLISYSVHPAERTGQRPRAMSRILPNALALLAIHQLEKLDHLNAHRRSIAAHYANALEGVTGVALPAQEPDTLPVFLRYTLRTEHAVEMMHCARKANVRLGDWYRTVIAPVGTERIATYERGSCPTAERVALQTVNLPTEINVAPADVTRIARIITQCV